MKFKDWEKKILIGNKILEYLKTGDKLYRKKEYKGAIINYTKAIELDELCEQAYRRRRLAREKINDKKWIDDEKKMINIGAYGELKEPGFFKEEVIGFFESLFEDIIKGLNKIDSFFSDDEYIASNERKSTYNSDIKERKTKKSEPKKIATKTVRKKRGDKTFASFKLRKGEGRAKLVNLTNTAKTEEKTYVKDQLTGEVHQVSKETAVMASEVNIHYEEEININEIGQIWEVPNENLVFEVERLVGGLKFYLKNRPNIYRRYTEMINFVDSGGSVKKILFNSNLIDNEIRKEIFLKTLTHISMLMKYIILYSEHITRIAKKNIKEGPLATMIKNDNNIIKEAIKLLQISTGKKKK